MAKRTTRKRKTRLSRHHRKSEKMMRKKLVNEGTKVTRTKTLKKQVAIRSVIGRERHLSYGPRFPSNDNVPKISLRMKKKVVEYKRQQLALEQKEKQASDERRKQQARQRQSLCTTTCSEAYRNISDDELETMMNEPKFWSNIDVLESMIADREYVSRMKPSVRNSLVRGIGMHLGDILSRYNNLSTSIIVNIFQMSEELREMLVQPIVRACTDVLRKCEGSFEILAFAFNHLAQGNPEQVKRYMEALLNKTKTSCLQFENGIRFVGCCVETYPDLWECAFGAIKFEENVQEILSHPSKPGVLVPLFSTSSDHPDVVQAKNFISRVIMRAVTSMSPDSVSEQGRHVVSFAAVHGQANRKSMWVSDAEFDHVTLLHHEFERDRVSLRAFLS